MATFRSSAASRYAGALIILGAAVALRLALDSLGLIGIPFLTFYPSVVISAWLGGLGPGLLATAVGAVVAWYGWLSPPGFQMSVSGWIGLATFAVSGFAISVLSEMLHRARALAERENRAKDEFLAMLSHELRNPLAAITTAAGLMEMLDSTSGPALDRARAAISRQSRHLASLLDDLLDVTRASTGRILLRSRPLDLAAVVLRAVGTLRDAGRTSGHNVTVDARPVWIEGDELRLTQVVVNLVSNALQYTPAGGAITVRVRKERDYALLEVEDTGAGIDAELLPRVFDPFVQGEQGLERSQGGLGLGLTLVKRLMEAHGGDVRAFSGGPGQGARFSVRLPVSREVERPRPDAITGTDAQGRRILVVEDNEDTRQVLTAMLDMLGHTVREAADGPSSVELARQWQPEIVLLDLGLPGMDGYKVASRLRDEGLSPRIIALTGYGREEDIRRSREAGFADHLVKPVSVEKLVRALAHAGEQASFSRAGE